MESLVGEIDSAREKGLEPGLVLLLDLLVEGGGQGGGGAEERLEGGELEKIVGGAGWSLGKLVRFPEMNEKRREKE